MTNAEGFLSRLEKAGRIGEDAILVLVLTSMILLAAAQIIMRNFLNFGFIWTDELLRMLVLWVGIAGAVAASRSDRHINVAVLDRYLAGSVKTILKAVIHLFTAVVCGIVTWHSVQFVQTSREFGDVLLGGVPAWLLQLVMPVGFGLISYRYSLFTLREVFQLARGGSQP